MLKINRSRERAACDKIFFCVYGKSDESTCNPPLLLSIRNPLFPAFFQFADLLPDEIFDLLILWELKFPPQAASLVVKRPRGRIVIEIADAGMGKAETHEGAQIQIVLVQIRISGLKVIDDPEKYF